MSADYRADLTEPLVSPFKRVFPARHLRADDPVALYFTVTTNCLIGKCAVITHNVCLNILAGYTVISVKTHRCVRLYFSLL